MDSIFECNTSFKKLFFMVQTNSFHLDKVFYAGLAYFILFVLVYAIGRVIGLFIPLIPTPEKWEEYPFLDCQWCASCPSNLLCSANGIHDFCQPSPWQPFKIDSMEVSSFDLWCSIAPLQQAS